MIKRKYVAFDIEIAKSIPGDVGDWKTLRPLGISCAATLTGDGNLTTWHGTSAEGDITDQMSQIEAAEMVEYLLKIVESGYTILTWNGLGFDFDILSEESQMSQVCKDLAWEHVDMMFHIFCLKGFPLGLDTAAKGMGLPGKPAGMTGDKAPIYWAQGRREEVLMYVAQDVRTTLLLAQAVEQQHQLRWQSRSGRPQNLPMREGWFTVRQAIQLPEPDTSWMAQAWHRTKFTGWLD